MAVFAVTSLNVFGQVTIDNTKYYQIFSVGKPGGTGTGVAYYMKDNSGALTPTTTFNTTDETVLWELSGPEEGENANLMRIKNVATGKYLTVGTTTSNTSTALYVVYKKDQGGQKGYAIGTDAGVPDGTGCLELNSTTVIKKNNYADRERFRWALVAIVDKPVSTEPIISQSSGKSIQTIYVNQPISNIVYKWGGTATSAVIKWTGTANENTKPDGITVTPDNDVKTLTIAGAPTTEGTYGYSVTATDGILTTESLTGAITAKVTDKIKMAYVTSIKADGTISDERDQQFIDAFATDFDVNLIDATATGINYSYYDVIVLSAIPASGAAGSLELKAKSLTKPFVNLKGAHQLKSSAWNWGTTGNDRDTEYIVVSDKTHPVFAGVTYTGDNNDEVQLSSGATSAKKLATLSAWNTVVSGEEAISLAEAKGFSETSYMEIPVGTTLSGMTAPTQYKQIHLGVAADAWSGYLTADAITITVNAAKYVATPSTPSYTLTVTTPENGTISIDPTSADNTYLKGTEVSLTATPAFGYEFDVWTGDATGSATTTLTMDGDKNVSANFKKVEVAEVEEADVDGNYVRISWSTPYADNYNVKFNTTSAITVKWENELKSTMGGELELTGTVDTYALVYGANGDSFTYTVIANKEGNAPVMLVEDKSYLFSTTGISGISASQEIASIKYYTLTGIETNAAAKGVVIVKTTYADGSISVSKFVK